MQNFTTNDFTFFKESKMLVLSSVDFMEIAEVISVKSEHTGRTLKFNLKSIQECGRVLYEPATLTPNVHTLVMYPQFHRTAYQNKLNEIFADFDEMYQFSDDRRMIDKGNKQKKQIDVLRKILKSYDTM